MVSVTVGFILGARSLGLIDASLQSTLAERVTELALVFLLFSDSMRLDLGSLRRQLGWPSRLLLIGLPSHVPRGRSMPDRISAGLTRAEKVERKELKADPAQVTADVAAADSGN